MRCEECCDYMLVAKIFFALIIIVIFGSIGLAYFYTSDDPSPASLGIFFGVGVIFALLVFKMEDKEPLPGLHDPLIKSKNNSPLRTLYGPAIPVYHTSLAAREGKTAIQNTLKTSVQNTLKTSVQNTDCLIEQRNKDDDRRKHEASNNITV